MGISIVVDITRSRALMRTAKKHGSQALEADALHFSTDVWSSCVVIAGLAGSYWETASTQPLRLRRIGSTGLTPSQRWGWR